MTTKRAEDASGGNKGAFGVGIAALLAAAAGAYYLYGTDAGEKKRKQIKGWSLKMRGEVIEKLEGMKDWSEETYNGVIDKVSEKYKNIKNIDPVEVTAVVTDMKRHWRNIKRHIDTGKKKAPAAKKSTTTRKTPSKTTPKTEESRSQA